MMVVVFVVCNLIVDLLNARWTRAFVVMKERTRELFPLFRWSVRLALIIIALLALIALTASGGCRMTPRRLICRRACFAGCAALAGHRSLRSRYFLAAMAATRVSLGSVMACLLLVLN